jgi:hypothetical protein
MELMSKLGEIRDIKVNLPQAFRSTIASTAATNVTAQAAPASLSSSLVAVPLPLAWFEWIRMPSSSDVSVVLDEVRDIVEKTILRLNQALVQLDEVRMKIVEGVQARAGHFKSVSIGTQLLSMTETYVSTPIEQDPVDLSASDVLREPVQSLEDSP